MNYDKELHLIYINLDFYQQEMVEVNGEWYISVKGTAKAYKKTSAGIRYHINDKSEMFEGHIISGKTEKEKLFQFLTPKQRHVSDRIWLDKFAFYKIGTLLNSSPIMIPIKMICFLNNE